MGESVYLATRRAQFKIYKVMISLQENHQPMDRLKENLGITTNPKPVGLLNHTIEKKDWIRRNLVEIGKCIFVKEKGFAEYDKKDNQVLENYFSENRLGFNENIWWQIYAILECYEELICKPKKAHGRPKGDMNKALVHADLLSIKRDLENSGCQISSNRDLIRAVLSGEKYQNEFDDDYVLKHRPDRELEDEVIRIETYLRRTQDTAKEVAERVAVVAGHAAKIMQPSSTVPKRFQELYFPSSAI